MRIKLVIPNKEYEKDIINYKEEFVENRESMDGTAGLANINSIDEWLQELERNSREETVRDGLVPATTYLAVNMNDNRVIGMIDIRHKLNSYLLQFGGHIGYSVRKSERRKGYAKEMLTLALDKCKELKIFNVLITCNKENIASAKTIKANSGVLESEVLKDKEITQRYWIKTM